MIKRFLGAAFLSAALFALAGCPDDTPDNNNNNTPDASCTPACTGKTCGDDGCGGTCGSCATGETCNAGTCETTCTPACDGKVCGDNGCGGQCGPGCGTGEHCDNGACVPDCVPQCDGKVCGDNGCGGECGPGCQNGQTCEEGQCFGCVDTGGSTPIENLCNLLDGGFLKWKSWEYQACGFEFDDSDPSKLNSADIEHFDAEFWQWAGYGYVFPIGDLNAQLTCANDMSDEYNLLKSSVQAGYLCYDSKAVDDCAAAGLAAKANKEFGTAPAEVCNTVFKPNQRAGMPCLSRFDCVSGTYCRPANNATSCAGVCSEPLAHNAACNPDFDRCAKDSACTEDPANPGTTICLPYPGEGEACDSQCRTGFYCLPGATENDPGICTAQKQETEACTADAECAGDLICMFDAAGAGACSQLSQQGGPCTEAGHCADDLVCAYDEATGTGTCESEPAPAQLGEACGGPGGAECDFSGCLYCTGDDETEGTCMKFQMPGDTCLTGQDQNGNTVNYCADLNMLLVCDQATMKCKLYPREGEACVVSSPQDQTMVGNCGYLDNFCKRTAGTDAQGICAAAYKQIGESCANVASDSPYCVEGAFCDSATSLCTATKADGETCTNWSECTSTNCASNGVCAPMPAAGEACQAFDDGEGGFNYYCADDHWCDEDNGAVCVAYKAGGEACADDAECASGTCGSAGVCVEDCQYIGGGTVGCSGYDGVGWFLNYIFVSGMLVFVAMRRRRK